MKTCFDPLNHNLNQQLQTVICDNRNKNRKKTLNCYGKNGFVLLYASEKISVIKYLL